MFDVQLLLDHVFSMISWVDQAEFHTKTTAGLTRETFLSPTPDTFSSLIPQFLNPSITEYLNP
jgi:hypothetical protein